MSTNVRYAVVAALDEPNTELPLLAICKHLMVSLTSDTATITQTAFAVIPSSDLAVHNC